MALVPNLVLTELEQNCVNKLRCFLSEQTGLHSRTDDLFLLNFLQGCDFNMNLTKRTIIKYYENIKQIPQWFRNRDLNNPNLNFLVYSRFIVSLSDVRADGPCVVLQTINRLEPKVCSFDECMKFTTICLERLAYRDGCPNNGLIWIVDCRNTPWWPAPYIMSPQSIKNAISLFILGNPVKLKKVILLEPPFITKVVWKFCCPFLSQSLVEMFQMVSGDWEPLYEFVPRERLPDEFGGLAGSLIQHADAFTQELMAFNHFILENEKFGYQD